MWTLVLRKIINNKWMMLCLLFGFIVVVAMVSAVPMYSDAILQRMLTEDLNNFQESKSAYTGLYTVQTGYNAYAREGDSRENAFYKQKDVVENTMLSQLNDYITDGYSILSAANMVVVPYQENGDDLDYSNINLTINAQSDFDGHIEITNGRMYEPGVHDGIYEAIVTEECYKELRLNLDTVYKLSSVTNEDDYVLVQVVGTFTAKDNDSPYWYITSGLSTYRSNLLFDYDTFENLLFSDYETNYMSKGEWRYAIDYESLEISDLPELVPVLEDQSDFYTSHTGYNNFRVPILETLEDYNSRATDLKTTLWVILVPILLMLSFYIFMVSQIIVKNEENEISVMRSRGASGKQIFILYLLESIVLGAVALALGPFIGYFMCSILGSANGFMEFVNRSALPVKMVGSAYLYAGAATILFIATMLIPAMKAARTTIVERKRKRSRLADQPFWKKYFLDFITLGVSIYGYYNYKSYSGLITATGKSAVNVQIDPLLFLVSSLFIIGCALVFLRIYPYLVRLVFFIGRRRWSPPLYASFIQVGRSNGQEQFLMIFLIMSIAVGIFSANTARTLNQNIEDRLSYSTGADVVLTPEWASQQAENPDGTAIEGEVTYIEPDFSMYENIDGVDAAARVYTNSSVKVSDPEELGNYSSGVTMMSIVPAEFSYVTWSRSDLFWPYHINSYLELLSSAPRAALVSASLRDKLNLKVGDTLKLSIGSQSQTEIIVYGFIDYWPSVNPYTTINQGNDTTYAQKDFIVTNLTFIQSKFTKQPYQVWLKKSEGVTDSAVLSYVNAHSELRVTDISYVNEQIVEAKNDPLLQGFNGMLTLGFIITMLVCVIGFLIYWILSIRNRTLQFGVFRAMGMSLKKVISMILCEQALISLVAILAGIILGGITSDMFVPMLEFIYSAAEKVPPFLVIATRADYYKIYVIIGCMLVIGVLALSRIIARTKIDQALKLGED